MSEQPIPSGPEQPSYEELRRALQGAQARILELERALLEHFKHCRLGARLARSCAEGQPLLDLAEGLEVKAPPREEEGAESQEEQDEDEEDEEDAGACSGRNEGKQGKGKNQGGRKALPAHLPRKLKPYEIDPERDLPGYDPSKPYQVVRHERSEELHVTKPEAFVVIHERPVVAYETAEGELRMAGVGGPDKIFPKCMASPSVLAKVAVERLHNHLTLYRIERFFDEIGAPVSRSTLAQWMVWLGELLTPLSRAQEEAVFQSFKLHADDTTDRVLAPELCDQVKIWALIGCGESLGEIVFRYTESRTSEEVLGLLGRFQGYLQVDACGVYDALYASGKIVEVGCWSHVKRKFDDVMAIDRRARPMLRMIRRLYGAEAHTRKMNGAERWVFRRLVHAPLIRRIGAWVKKQRALELLHSGFKKALNYVHNQWAALTRFLEDGRLALDNNLLESRFHVYGVGRRNHLFWGSREGLKQGLVLFGLIQSCVAHGIDPREYLEDVILRITRTDTRAMDMIPSRWKALVAKEGLLSRAYAEEINRLAPAEVFAADTG
jgi:transposase